MTHSERITRQAETYERRERRRFQEEEEAGTVFFSYEPECKLVGDRLLCFCFDLGGETDYVETLGFLLRRLARFRVTDSHVAFSGEFYLQTSPDSFHNVRERDARITSRTFRLKRPVQNETALMDYLDRMQRRAAELPAAGWKERVSGWFAQTVMPLLGLLAFPFLALWQIVNGLFSGEANGLLEGFDEIDGKHYPRYSFPLPDGARTTRTDRDISLEESVTENEAKRQLRRKLPRKVKVRYSKRHPEKSACKYL